MEVKKSPKADLEGKKTIFLEIGFVIALGILLSAFNWKTNTKVEEGFVITQEEQVEEEIIPITQQMMKPPPPPCLLYTSNKIPANYLNRIGKKNFLRQKKL